MSCKPEHDPAFLNRSGFAKCLLLVLTVFMVSPSFGEDKEDPKQDVPPAPEAPDPQMLQRALRDILRGQPANGMRNRRRGVRPMAPNGMFENDNSGQGRDPVDSRAPRDIKIEQLLQAADVSIQQKNWKSAVDLIQRLLDQSEDSLHKSSNGQWQSVRSTANQMLGQLPEAVLVEYRSRYAGLAQQQLAAARRSGLSADYVNVATRFFHTPAGYEAAYHLAVQHFDRSEFGLAARWFSELAASPAALNQQAPWLLQAALALKLAGDTAGSAALLSRLPQGPSTIVNLGTGPVKASEWLNQSQDETTSNAIALSDWTQLYGSASRTGRSVGGDALLAPDWTLPLTTSHIVQNSVKWLIHDLQDQQRSVILAAAPLAINGKVIYRDLRSIRCVDIEKGHTVWESVEGISPERILGGLPSQQIEPQDAWRIPVTPFLNSGDYQGLSAEYSPLANLMFRDGTYGLISSDGKQVFVIEDQGILSRNQAGQHWGWDGNADPQDPFGMSWKTNRLVSYDLATGRTLWSLGGTESRESFDLPLAGSYIYGTPAVEGGELFLVAGKGDDIRLWTIDRLTGQPKWSQLIAYSDTKIDLDLARRWITSQVAVGSGIVVCPTTVGWLVAVDRMRQSVLWAHRYASREASNSPQLELGTQFLPQQELNAFWCPSAPVISGSYVVYTPQEEKLLICLNVVDGRRIWEQPKQRGVYLAGVFDQTVVVVGESGVNAYQLTDGQSLWSTEFEEGIRPSGRGVAVGNLFYLPLSSGELQSIDLGTGKIVSQTFVAARHPSLGNLAMHHGKLVSLSPSGLTSFVQRDAILAEIQQRLQKDPNDSWALLRSSEIHLLNHEYVEALPLLRKISTKGLTDDEIVRHHAALIESLSTIIHSDILQHADELEELGRLVSSSAERLLFNELTAEKLLSEHRPVDAFDVLAKLAEDDGNSFVVRSDDHHVSARRIVWLSGRMSEIWTATPEAERALINERIKTLVTDASEQSAASCERAATLFAFHPAANVAQQRFVEWLVQSNDLGGARIVLQQLLESQDPTVAAQATERLARMMIQCQLPADAVYYYRLLETKFADIKVRDDQTGSQLATAARAEHQLDFEQRERSIQWSETPLQIEQSMVSYAQQSQDIVHDTPLPYFDRISLETYQNEQRMSLESVSKGDVEWMIPLRSAVRSIDDGYTATSHIGHQLYFVNRGVIHAVSPIDKRILWTKSLEDEDDGSFQGRHSSRPSVVPMIAPSRDENAQSLLLQRAYTTGHLAVVESNYLCVYGRRSLSILDPRTGEELWNLDSLPMNAQIVGTRNAIFAIVPGKPEVQAYRASDGKPLEIPEAAKLLNSAIMTYGSSLVLLERSGSAPLAKLGIKQAKAIKVLLRLYDPVERVTRWKIEFPSGTLVSPLGLDEVVAVQSDGQIQKIDLATGHAESLESIDKPANKPSLPTEKYLLADEDRIYLVVNDPDSGSAQYGESLSSIRVQGKIFAWDRTTNRLAWSQPVAPKHQNLIVDRFSRLPVLLMVSRTWRQQAGLSIGRLSIMAIHKSTGKTLIDVKIPSAFSGFHAINLNAEGPSIDLKSYNLRLRLLPVEVARDTQTETEQKPSAIPTTK